MPVRSLLRLLPAKGSLLATLIVRLTATTFFLTVAIVAWLLIELQLHVDTIRDRSLIGQAEDIARHLIVEPGKPPRMDLPPDLAIGYGNEKSGYSFQVRSPAGDMLFSSAGGAAALNRGSIGTAAQPELFLVADLSDPQGLRIYGAGIRVVRNGRPFDILVGQSERHSDILVDQLLEELFEEVWWVLPFILLLFVAVNVATVKFSLRRVEEVSALANRIGAGASDPSLPDGGLPDEIVPLVRAVNLAFGRLAQALRTEREFTADAAHELRTPLAVLRANIDTLGDESARDALRRDVTNMARIVDQLLRIAQLDALDVELQEDVDLSAVARDVAVGLGHLAVERGLSLAVDTPEAPVAVRGDTTLLRHALTNLVENAFNHSPPGGEITIAVDPAGKLVVDDRGPGVPPEDREHVFQRFWRKRRGGPGAGIGLSIVAKVADIHGGRASVGDAPGGGARFEIDLSRVALRGSSGNLAR
jgi:signal transduction histidine kinase